MDGVYGRESRACAAAGSFSMARLNAAMSDAAAVRGAGLVSLWVGAGTPESGAETGPSSRNVRFRPDFVGCTPSADSQDGGAVGPEVTQSGHPRLSLNGSTE